MEEKKKRGCNYTTAEKDMLLDLVKKYQNIIENKETNARMILKKRQAWKSLCQQYNAVAVSGSRNWTQLRHLYENLKQRSKKNIARINRLQFYGKCNELKKKAVFDKKQINCTGGGAYKTSLTEQDAQILAMVAPQVQPLENPYDDAALYFGDIEVHIENEAKDECWEFNETNDVQHTESSTKPCTITFEETEVQHTSASKPCSKQKRETIKEQYFKAKLRNAKLELNYLINKKKMEMNKYKIEMSKHKIEIQILKLRLKKNLSSAKR